MAQKIANKRKSKRGRRSIQHPSKFMVGFLALMLVAILSALLLQITQLYASAGVVSDQRPSTVHKKLAQDFRKLSPEIRDLVDDQIKYNLLVVPNATIQQEITGYSVAFETHDDSAARTSLNQLTKDYTGWRQQLDAAIQQQTKAQAAAAESAVVVAPTTSNTLQVPIVIYHHTPSDFEQQLQYLQAHHYNAINPDQLAAALLSHAALPSKPILITFDDGFADQMQAFSLLQKYGMSATFYIIDGGPNSQWCIGANRRYNDPSQPPGGCGDAYLNWDQVRQLDQSGLITIGSHTIDHPDLATMSADQQSYEIIQGKAQLEAQLGHAVHSFAYPYGSYNATTLSLVRQAGFTTAVTTLPGTLQSASGIDELFRIRVVTNLP